MRLLFVHLTMSPSGNETNKMEADGKKSQPKLLRVFQNIEGIFLTFFFSLILIGVIGLIGGFWGEITTPGLTYDFFGKSLEIRTIALILVLLLVPISLLSFIKLMKWIKAKIRHTQLKMSWVPRISVIAIIIMAIIGVNYYMPFWYITNDSKLTTPPYIAYYGEKGFSISWDTTQLTTSKILWGTDPENLNNEKFGGPTDLIASNTEESYHHIVILANLLENQKYYYKISELGEDVYSFTTAPSVDSNAPVTFTIVGDTQGGFATQKQNVALMKNDPEGLNFTVIMGDLVNRNDAMQEWAMLFHSDSYGSIISSVPWMNAPGNHETYCTGDVCAYRSNYKTYFQYDYPVNHIIVEGARDLGLYHSYNYSNVHMVALDLWENQTYTDELGKQTGSFLTTTQLEWLDEDLAKNSQMWKFVYFHVPMYSDGDFGSNIDLCSQLEPIFEKHQVDAVFYGHDHHYESYLVNESSSYGGIYHFIVGGGGGGIDGMMNSDRYGDRAWTNTAINFSSTTDTRYDVNYGHEYARYGELVHHYMKVHIEGDSAIFTAIRSEDGSIIEEIHATR